MNFDELVDIINNMKKIKGEICLICNFPIDINIIDNNIELKCKHTYHNSCISIIKNNNIIICPYCQKKTDYSKSKSLEKYNKNKCSEIIKSGIKKGKNCNKINCNHHKKNITQCSEIIKTGVKKGEKCNKINCNRHNKIQKLDTNINTQICTNIIKSGIKKGEICNRTNCNYHNKNIIV